MKSLIFHLAEQYPFLKNGACDPWVEVLLQSNTPEVFEAKETHPCLLICPGGGYAMVSDREGEPIALEFMPLGYQAVVLHYSVAPDCVFPQQMLETAAAMDLIVNHAKEWNIDTNRIAIIGFSAGAHLAASYTTLYNLPAVQDKIQARGVNACILGYGVLGGPRIHRESLYNLLGKTDLTDADLALHCLNLHVTEQTPPTFLWHTAEDTCVPVENSLDYAAALSAHKVPFELHIFPTGYHGLATCDVKTGLRDENTFACRKWIALCRDWLVRTLPDPNAQ